jgi:threonine dehydratase
LCFILISFAKFLSLVPEPEVYIMANISNCPPLTRDSVIEAHRLIESHIHRTPVVTSSFIDKFASTPRDTALFDGRDVPSQPANPQFKLHFKCENFQRAGAFKARGAFHAIERLKLEPGWAESGGKEKGVATHSSGSSLSHWLKL